MIRCHTCFGPIRPTYRRLSKDVREDVSRVTVFYLGDRGDDLVYPLDEIPILLRRRNPLIQWRIGLLYKQNEERVGVLAKPALFEVEDGRLRQQIEGMARQRDKELSDPGIPLAQRKVLESLKEHWSGLTVFVDNPRVPLDNNQAERDMRGPVVGRKNYYGSGARWAGELAAMMFSLFETLEGWNLEPRDWLTAYLQECARAGGKRPEDIEALAALEDERIEKEGVGKGETDRR